MKYVASFWMMYVTVSLSLLSIRPLQLVGNHSDLFVITLFTDPWSIWFHGLNALQYRRNADGMRFAALNHSEKRWPKTRNQKNEKREEDTTCFHTSSEISAWSEDWINNLKMLGKSIYRNRKAFVVSSIGGEQSSKTVTTVSTCPFSRARSLRLIVYFIYWQS